MYVLLEVFFAPDNIDLAMDEDGNGNTMIFDSHEDAERWGKENLQMPQVIEIVRG